MKCFKLQGFDGFKSDYVKLYKKLPFNPEIIKKTIYKNNKDGKWHVKGDYLQKIWFPTDIKYDIFISHSHSDVELAKNIAAELEKKYDVKCFIDSEVWHYYVDIGEQLAELFPEKDTEGIKVDAYMLLTEALMRVIFNTENFFFLETDKSIDYLNNNQVTYSPWLFLELSLAKQLYRKQTIKRVALLECKIGDKEYLKVDFKAFIEDFYELNKFDLFELSKSQNIIWQCNKKNAFENIINMITKRND